MNHGTYAGWNRHVKRGEEPCPDCKAAQNRYVAHRRFKRGDQLSPRRCACGSVFPDHTCHATSRHGS